MAQNQNDHLHAWVLDLPPTVLQKRLALGLIVATVVAFVAVLPVAGHPLVEMNALFPSLDAIVLITDMITAVLLFAQFSLSGARPLLALATGYLFTALIVVPHALTFAGAFSPGGLLGAGVQTGSWLFIFWHLGFALGLLAYAALRISKPTEPMPKTSVSAAIWSAAAGSLALVGALTWLATAGQSLLPTLILDNGRLGPNVPYIILCLIAVCGAAVALLLLIRQRSELDHWLIVVAAVSIGELAFSGLLPAVRFSAGFYAGRVFSLITSSIVLIVLLAETTRLYAQVVRSNATLQRERDNKLMNMEAMTASIAHEVSQPLTAISSSGAAALNWLKRTPPDLEEAKIALNAIIDAGHGANAVFDNMRTLFARAEPIVHSLDLNSLISEVVRTLDAEFKQHRIQIEADLSWRLPPILGHSGQLQEVISNLLNNAIEAIGPVSGPRVVKIRTAHDSEGRVAVTVEDSGRGLNPETAQSIFEPFVTTKARGMGLGLAICQMIIQRHNGELSARPAKTRGAIFQITLPQAKV
jgi:signal transduction histidine kinase